MSDAVRSIFCEHWLYGSNQAGDLEVDGSTSSTSVAAPCNW